jgi:hypothetical protein
MDPENGQMIVQVSAVDGRGLQFAVGYIKQRVDYQRVMF